LNEPGLVRILVIEGYEDNYQHFLACYGGKLFFLALIDHYAAMVIDVLTTNAAINRGYDEINPLLGTLIRDPALHLLFKVTFPLLLLFLCIFIYFSEKRYGMGYSSSSRRMLELAKISIFFVLAADCIVYIEIILHNLILLSA